MLAELGILISSILLSLGGCWNVTCVKMRRSRCTKIELSDCLKCHRDVVSSSSDQQDDDEHDTTEMP